MHTYVSAINKSVWLIVAYSTTYYCTRGRLFPCGINSQGGYNKWEKVQQINSESTYSRNPSKVNGLTWQAQFWNQSLRVQKGNKWGILQEDSIYQMSGRWHYLSVKSPHFPILDISFVAMTWVYGHWEGDGEKSSEFWTIDLSPIFKSF